jgi:hypothetical protein
MSLAAIILISALIGAAIALLVAAAICKAASRADAENDGFAQHLGEWKNGGFRDDSHD